MTEEEIRASERLKCCAEVEAYAMEWVSRMQTRFPESDHDDFKATGWQILQAGRNLLTPRLDVNAPTVSASSAAVSRPPSLMGGCRCGSDGSPYAPCVCGGASSTVSASSASVTQES